MKYIVVIPLVIVLDGLLGFGGLRLSGWPTYLTELLAAGGPNLVAGMLALVPPLIQRPNGQAAVVQGAFHGMLIHMGATLALGVVVFVAAGPKGLAIQPYALWMMWFFFVTLATVSTLLIRLIRSTPIAKATP